VKKVKKAKKAPKEKKAARKKNPGKHLSN